MSVNLFPIVHRSEQRVRLQLVDATRRAQATEILLLTSGWPRMKKNIFRSLLILPARLKIGEFPAGADFYRPDLC
jgi:hypothetical protein